MTGKELALRAIALSVVKAWLAEEDTRVRKQLATAMAEEDSRGYEPKVNGESVGKAVPRKGATRVSASVTDEAALIRWCRKHAPHMLTETVRITDQQALIAQAKTNGGLLDKAEGTVTEIDGITVTETVGEPGVTVTPGKDAADLIRAAVACGDLTFAELVQIDGAQ